MIEFQKYILYNNKAIQNYNYYNKGEMKWVKTTNNNH